MDEAPRTPHLPQEPLDLRGGVPDERLASRELRVFGGVEVAYTRYLPGEMEVPPLRGYTVNLRLGGTGRVVTRLGGLTHERPLVAGLVEVFEGGEPLEWALEGSISENINVLLAKDFVGRGAEGAGIDPGGMEVRDALNANDPQAGRILTLFLDELRTGGLGGELYAQSLATALAVHLLREHTSLGGGDRRRAGRSSGAVSGNLSSRALKRVLDYVGENLNSDLSLESMARTANLSPRHFSRVFGEATGLPPHRYVIARRVEKARGLLASTDLPVGQVALACGFAHQGHLARHFRRIVGVSPARSREESRR